MSWGESFCPFLTGESVQLLRNVLEITEMVVGYRGSQTESQNWEYWLAPLRDMSQALSCLLLVCHKSEIKNHLVSNSDTHAVGSNIASTLEEVPLGLGP